MAEMKRNVKDSVFTVLFREKKYAVELYKTLHPEDTMVTEADCKVITTENVLINGMHNDLGLLIRDVLIILVEAQSTFSPNITLRMLLYLAAEYKEYVDKNELDLYGSKPLVIPKPELYVVYTGERENVPDEIHLSDLFSRIGNPAPLELTVRVLRYDGSMSIIDQYVQFCKICDEQRKKYGYTKKAVEMIIRICMERGILAPFLNEHKSEVLDMMTLLFSEERLKEIHNKAVRREIYNEAKEEGIAEGIAKGIEQGIEKGIERGIEQGIEKGIERGIEQGIEKGRADTARLLMERFNLSADEVKAALEGR